MFPPLEEHPEGYFIMFSSQEGHPSEYLPMFSPLQGTLETVFFLKGLFVTFSPLRGNFFFLLLFYLQQSRPRGHL